MKNLTLFACTAVVSHLVIACGDNQEAPVAFPQTCAEVAQGHDSYADGEYQLYIGNDQTKPWTAYCADLQDNPHEYLTLPNGSRPTGGSTWSTYRAGGRSVGTDVWTHFEKVGIDPISLKLDIGDQTFAISNGSLTDAGGQVITSMPLGMAMTCGGGDATAQIDVSGTPFFVADTFAAGGDAGFAGHADLWSNQQTEEMWADGDCALVKASLAPASVVSQEGSFTIQLTYHP